MEVLSGDLFSEQLFKTELTLTPKEFGKNLDDQFLKILKSRVEDKLILDKGYIDKDSVEILKRQSSHIEDNTFTGNIVSTVIYKARVCNPPIGTVVRTRIENSNDLGFLAPNGPLYIMVPKDVHKNLELFLKYSRGSEIMIRIIGKEFDMSEKFIKIIGRLEEDIENGINKKMIVKRKINSGKSNDISEITEITETGNVLEDEGDSEIDEEEDGDEDGKNVLEDEGESKEEDVEEEDITKPDIEIGDGESEDVSDFELDEGDVEGDNYEFEEQENENYE